MKLLYLAIIISVLFVSGCIGQSEPSTVYQADYSINDNTFNDLPIVENEVITREISKQDSSIEIILDIKTGNSKFYTLNEKIPKSFEIVSISSSSCNIINNEINCVGLSDTDDPLNDLKIMYTISLNDLEPGIYKITGTYTMENTELTKIQGSEELII